VRRLIMWFMPDTMKAAAEAESRAWIGQCPNCGTRNSIWDVGGIRYKAAGRPTIRVKCPTCGKTAPTAFRKQTS
jgi:endogenous inhibitor of DNA gyrase (YacG/DUF329 family)